MSISYRKYFLFTNIFFGLVYIFIIPPFQAPDEDNHFFRCFQLAHSTKSDLPLPDNRLGGFLPVGIREYAQQFKYMRFNYNGKISRQKLCDNNEKTVDWGNQEFVDFTNTAIYSPTAYPLQTITCWLSCKLKLKPSTALYLMRISSLLTWLLFILIALKWIPDSRLLFLFLTTLPSLLVLHCSVSADVITNAMSFLLVALIFKMRRETQSVSQKQIFLFAAIIILSAINKIIYFPMIVLWFLVPHSKFKSRRDYYIYFILIAMVSILSAGFWSHKANDSYITYEEYHPEYRDDQQIKPNGNPMEQTKYVLTHPVAFTKNMVKSYVSVVPSSAAHLTGKFGWEKNYLPAWMIAFLWSMILFMMMQASFEFTIKERIIIVLSILGCLVLFAIVMYGIYSPVGNDYIFNLGGKYLIPILPLMIFVLSGQFISEKNVVNWAKVLLLVAHSLMIYSILQRYYI